MDAASLVAELQSGLAQLAREQNASVHDFAATLLLAIVRSGSATLVQIGDGCWIASGSSASGCPPA